MGKMVLKYYKNIDDRNVFEEALKYFNNKYNQTYSEDYCFYQ